METRFQGCGMVVLIFLYHYLLSLSLFLFYFLLFLFVRGGENLKLKLDRVGSIARARGEFLEGETVKIVLLSNKLE